MTESAVAYANIATGIIPQTRVASKVVGLVWWVCLFAVIIALILIIVSISYYVKGNSSAGLGFLITGGILGGAGGFGMWYTNQGLGGILVSRMKQLGIKGRGEYEFDGETVTDVPKSNCSTTGGREYEEFDEDINELDYLEESDEDEENPFEEENEAEAEKEVEKKEIEKLQKPRNKKKSKKVSFKKTVGKEEDTTIDHLKSILELLGAENLFESKDVEIDDLLDKIQEQIQSLNAAYKKLDSDKKGEVDNLLNFLNETSNKKLESFKSDLIL
jgi:hypothetical protein